MAVADGHFGDKLLSWLFGCAEPCRRLCHGAESSL